jgi:hypothetical protein
MNIIDTKYEYWCNTKKWNGKKVTTNYNLPDFKRYASECEHITEIGVHFIVSTWGFLAGHPKRMISIDIEHPSFYGGDLKTVFDGCKEVGIVFNFIQASSHDVILEETDLLYIDSDHTYKHLSGELTLHGNKARKYIILHDTITRAEQLLPAMNEFLEANKHWKVHEVINNQCGVTVLKRS